MNFLNVSKYSTSAGATSVLVLDGNNVVKYRTASEVVSDGGGGATAPRTQCFLLGGVNGTGTSEQITIPSGKDGYGFPYDGVGTQADSLLRAGKFALNFNPTNFRISANVVTAPTYSGTTPSSGNFGVKLQWSTNNSTWNDFSSTLNFRGTSNGAFADTSGTITTSGYSYEVYIRMLCVNTLNTTTDGYVNVRNLALTFWN